MIIFSISAQPVLLPRIGVGNLPSDSDPICTIPMVGGSSSNIFVEDTIPHFKLYDINGVQMDIGSTLQQGKAVLIMCGSFTCPAFRNKVDELATIAAMFPTQLEVMMIYTLNGKLVQTVFTASFSIEQLPQGTYLINVETEKGIAKSKFVRID